MADIVLRNLDDDLKEKLRLRAASNQRSMSAELREIVSATLAQRRSGSRAQLKKLAADIRALSAGRWQTPSEGLLRESRDERQRGGRRQRGSQVARPPSSIRPAPKRCSTKSSKSKQ